MTTTLNTLAAQSARTGEIAHCSLSTLIETLREKALAADEQILVETLAGEMHDLGVDGYEGDECDDGRNQGQRWGVLRKALLLDGTDDLAVDNDVAGHKTWDITGTIDGDAYRVVIDLAR